MPSTHQSIVIDRPIADVWAKLNNFHDLSWSSGVISSVEKVGDIDGHEVGAKRILNGVFHETLISVEEANHSLQYSIDDGPSPVSRDEVSDYIGVIRLGSGSKGGTTLVEWSSSWKSNSEDAAEFCHGIYVALLNELANSFGQ